jgi:hypothetical protein
MRPQAAMMAHGGREVFRNVPGDRKAAAIRHLAPIGARQSSELDMRNSVGSVYRQSLQLEVTAHMLWPARFVTPFLIVCYFTLVHQLDVRSNVLSIEDAVAHGWNTAFDND